MKFQRKKLAVLIAGAVGAGSASMLVATQAAAQISIGTIEKKEITGSNIKRADTETASPVQVITREDIDATGLNTISDVVRQITANNNGTMANAWSGLGFAQGASGVSLRGLGSQNTLILMNGRRLAVFGLADDGKNSFVDLNQIPMDVVERIEILKSGASAVYGADAVAGVVNIITRQQFTGGAINATGGTSYKNDDNQYRGSITLGSGDLTKDKYNAYITFDGQHQNALATFNKRRSYVGSLDLSNYGNANVDLRPGTLGNGNNDNSLSSSSLVGNVRPIDPVTGEAGPYQSLPGCNPANLVGPQQLCAYDYKQFLQIEPKTDKINVFARGAYNFTDTMQGYAELSFFQSKLDAVGPPLTTNNAWYNTRDNVVVDASNTILPLGNPANPFNAQGMDARLRYALGDVGGVDEKVTSNTQRYLVGLKGTNWDWDWDAAFLYIDTKTKLDLTGYVNYPNLLLALNGQGGFGYYQPGVAAVNNNPAIYNFIAPKLSYETDSTISQVEVKGSRDLMQMDGGAMALALGAGYRHESVNDPGVPGTFTGDILAYGYAAANGTRNVTNVYAELFMPILKNLEATAALRYDHYSDFGNTWNPLVQAKWTVVPSFLVRGTFATGFRAPGPAEIGNAANVGFTTYIDPVRCPVTDLPADCGQGQAGQSTAGNPFIKPETSDTWTAGFIWEPTAGLSATVDYWYIKTKNLIAQPDVQAVINNPSQFPGTSVVRSQTDNLPGIPDSGTLLLVNGAYQNLASQVVDGLDVDLLWKYNTTNYGRYTTEVQWSHYFQFKRTIGGQTIDYVNSHGPTSLSSSAGTPQDRVNVILGWTQGPWTATGTVRYIAPIPQLESKGQTADDGPNPCINPQLTNPSCKAPSFTTLDLSAQYTGFRNWTIYGSIINVFNRLAPFDPQAGYGYYNYNINYAQSGATGTLFNLGAKYVWDAPPQKVAQVAPAPAPVVQPAPAPAPVPPPPPAPKPAPQVQRITLDSKVLFDFDKADLKPEGKAAIDSQVVGKLAQVQKLEVVLVTGHTDRIGSEAYNQKLSERRANVVRDYLVSKGVDKAKIETIGMGEKQPVVQCSQKDMKALIECLAPNRRVEVQVKGESTK